MSRRAFNSYLIERIKRENELEKIDKNRWYHVNIKCLSSELANKFVQYHLDGGTDAFIKQCYTQSNSMFKMFFYSILRSILKLFLSSTSICGILNCGSMFVLSNEQFFTFVATALKQHKTDQRRPSQSMLQSDALHLSLVQQHKNELESYKFGTMLDIGAGDGAVTCVMSPFFQQTYVTEISKYMHKRLRTRGYKLLDVEKWHHLPEAQSLDLISCLNVLDRCDRPLDMLHNIHRCLRHSNGLLLLAVVFPMYQFVEYKKNHLPEQVLTGANSGSTFEHQVVQFHRQVLQPAGFELLKWTKLPYLCEGNIDLTYFWLLDAVFLLRTIPLSDER